MVFKWGYFYDEKVNYYMTKKDKQWKKVSNFPTCMKVTEQEASGLVDNGP